MLAPGLDVMHLKARTFEIGCRHADMVEFAAGKNVARNGDGLRPLSEKSFAIRLGGARNRMVQIKPLRLQQAMDGLEIGLVVGKSDMFEHADGCNLVEAAFEARVILQFNGDAGLQTELR